MKNTMNKTVSTVLAVMMVMVIMACVFSSPAKADWNSYVGTYECVEDRSIELQICTNGTASLYSVVNPYLGGNYTYFINQNGILCTSDGTAFATNGLYMTASNGYHWLRLY